MRKLENISSIVALEIWRIGFIVVECGPIVSVPFQEVINVIDT